MAPSFREEMIGKHVEVEGTSIKGTVIDETKHTLLIETQEGNRKMIKSGHTFLIRMKEGIMRIPGSGIASRPEERIKNQ